MRAANGGGRLPRPGAGPRHRLRVLLTKWAWSLDSQGLRSAPLEVIVPAPAPSPPCPRSRPAQPTFSPEGQAASDTTPKRGCSPATLRPLGAGSQRNFLHQQGPNLLWERRAGKLSPLFSTPRLRSLPPL